jgi:AcrR family transcriptional regulator
VAQQTRQQLLDAALAHVTEHGIGDIGFRELARALGTTHRALGYHFGSKDGLLVEIVRTVEQSQREALATLASPVGDGARPDTDDDPSGKDRSAKTRDGEPDAGQAEGGPDPRAREDGPDGGKAGDSRAESDGSRTGEDGPGVHRAGEGNAVDSGAGHGGERERANGGTGLGPIERMRRMAEQLTDPALWPSERLFFELYGQALQGRPHAADLLPEVVYAWVEPLTEISREMGLPEEDAPACARLLLAVARGLLLDLLATGDQAVLERSADLFFDVLEQFTRSKP